MRVAPRDAPSALRYNHAVGVTGALDISVVVGTVAAADNIDATLESIAASVGGRRAEILVVDASTDGTAERAARHGVDVERRASGELVPRLWAAGIRRARGHVVAVTTGHTVVGPGWADALTTPLLRPEVGGVGGPLRLAPYASRVDAGVFFLRYAAFLPSVLADGPIAGEIAGDNAAYRREDLWRNPATLANGFWEHEFHKELRARGLQLWGASGAVADFGRAFPFGVIARHRFAHGREFGRSRLADGSRRAWQIVVGAPLVPALLTTRAARSVARDRTHVWPFVTALPMTMSLAAAWAAGEAVGALSPKGTP